MEAKNKFKHKFSSTDLIFILLNLFPICLYMAEQLDVMQAFMMFVFETVIIGIINIIRLIITTFYKKQDVWSNEGSTTMVSGWMFVIFFLLHYGFFVFIQLTLFMSFSGVNDGSFFEIFAAFKKAHKLLGTNGHFFLLLSALVFFIITMKDFITQQEYKNKSMMMMMFEPYMRIFIQQFVVILGSIFLRFNFGLPFLLIFVGAKIYFGFLFPFGRILNTIENKIKKQNKVIEEED